MEVLGKFHRLQLQFSILHNASCKYSLLPFCFYLECQVSHTDTDMVMSAHRKRYEHAEAEFIAAKQILHDTSETKELLSEHLCNVIQQNEIRKAKKLAELLHALNVESGVAPSASMPSLPVLLQRTPTPGLDVWPRKERRKTSVQKTDSPLLAAEEKTKSPSTAGSEAVSTTANRAGT